MPRAYTRHIGDSEAKYDRWISEVTVAYHGLWNIEDPTQVSVYATELKLDNVRLGEVPLFGFWYLGRSTFGAFLLVPPSEHMLCGGVRDETKRDRGAPCSFKRQRITNFGKFSDSGCFGRKRAHLFGEGKIRQRKGKRNGSHTRYRRGSGNYPLG
jgi:hypothetical protein